MKRIPLRSGLAVAAAVALLAGCAQSQRESASAGASAGGTTKDTFVFAASSDPVMLDPAMASDGDADGHLRGLV